jgi:hypothetical protein
VTRVESLIDRRRKLMLPLHGTRFFRCSIWYIASAGIKPEPRIGRVDSLEPNVPAFDG